MSNAGPIRWWIIIDIGFASAELNGGRMKFGESRGEESLFRVDLEER